MSEEFNPNETPNVFRSQEMPAASQDVNGEETAPKPLVPEPVYNAQQVEQASRAAGDTAQQARQEQEQMSQSRVQQQVQPEVQQPRQAQAQTRVAQPREQQPQQRQSQAPAQAQQPLQAQQQPQVQARQEPQLQPQAQQPQQQQPQQAQSHWDSQQGAQPQQSFQQPAATAMPSAGPQSASAMGTGPQPASVGMGAGPQQTGGGVGPQQAAAAYAPPLSQMPPIVVQSPPVKKSRGWIVGVVGVVCFFLFMMFCVKMISDSFSSGFSDVNTLTSDAVAVIDLTGTIQYDDSACSPEGLKQLLDAAEENAHVKAVVLRVDSGGGTATAGEEMAKYVHDFSKPVVVSSASINASAAYEISSQADYIYVAKSTEIGAIGTAMQLTDLSKLMEILGINMDVITSADSKDSSYGFRPLTDEERAYYQHMVDQINQTFIENVATGRNMSQDAVRALATGLPFTGIDSIQNGLADEVGTLEDATNKAAKLAGTSDFTTVELSFTSYDISGLYDILGTSDTGETIGLAPLEGKETAKVKQ